MFEIRKLCLNCNKLSTPGNLMYCKITGQIKMPLSKACEHWGPSSDVAHLFKEEQPINQKTTTEPKEENNG